MGYVALFVALGGTSAYAANTVFSTDIVDGQVKSVDIGDGEVKSADVKDESLTTFDVSTFLGVDIVDGTITNADLAPGVGAAPFIGRGRLTCNGGGSCGIFDFRPQGFTDNLEPPPVENRLFKAPPGRPRRVELVHEPFFRGFERAEHDGLADRAEQPPGLPVVRPERAGVVLHE